MHPKTIFEGGTSSITTGYKISTGQDLGQIFLEWNGTAGLAGLTGYKANGQDLNKIFLKK